MMFRLLAFSALEWSWPMGLVLLLFLLLVGRWVYFFLWLRKERKQAIQTRFVPTTIVRVAYLYKSMLYLCPRTTTMRTHVSEYDLPFEISTRRNETVEHALKRLLAAHYEPKAFIDVRFSIKHLYKSAKEERITYLFVVDVKDEKMLPSQEHCRCKLWTLQQIASNVGKGFFSPYFEQELFHWEMVIDMWSTYRYPKIEPVDK